MAEDRERGSQSESVVTRSRSESEVQTGGDSEVQTLNPGRTPGKAEGDEETADEALRKTENG